MTATPDVDSSVLVDGERLIDLTAAVPRLVELPNPRGATDEGLLPSPPRSDHWIQRYQRLIAALDSIALLGPALVALLVEHCGFTSITAAPAIAVTWLLLLAWSGAYDRRYLGSSDEMRRVLDASVRLVALVGCVSWLSRPPVSRTYVLAVGLLRPAGLFAGRIAGRVLLHRYRSVGRCRNRGLAGGSAGTFEQPHEQARRA